MRTLTEEQFKTLYGEQSVNLFDEKNKTEQEKTGVRGFLSRTFDIAKENLGQAVSSVPKNIEKMRETDGGQTERGTASLRLFTEPVAKTTEALFSPVTAFVEGAYGGAVPSSVAFAVGEAQKVPEVNNFLSKVGELYQKYPEEAGLLGDIAEIATTFWGGKAVKEPALNTVEAGIKQTTGIIDDLASGAKALTTQTPEEIASQRLAGALQDVTPRFEMLSTTQKGKVLGRTKEGGLLSGRKVTPNKLEEASARALSSLDEYNPLETSLSKYQLVDRKIAEEAEALKTALKGEKIIIPKKEISSNISKSIKEVVKDSLTFQKTDPIVQNYTKVLTTALRKSDGTISGILDVRKKMDSAYKNSRGKLAFGSEKISSLDEIHSASRDALNQLLFKYAKNTDVQKSLKFQSDLFRALDNLRFVAEREAGTSIGRLMQKYPIATKIGKEMGKAVGIGKAVEVFTP